jgi:hypothetical protein
MHLSVWLHRCFERQQLQHHAQNLAMLEERLEAVSAQLFAGYRYYALH